MFKKMSDLKKRENPNEKRPKKTMGNFAKKKSIKSRFAGGIID